MTAVASRARASANHRRWKAARERSGLTGVEAELHEAAVGAAGYHDFGEQSYRAGLRRLLESIEQSGYSRDQQAKIRRSAVPILVSRLYSARGWAARPRSLDNPVVAPLVVCGLPRTGTTALHKLLSMDDRFQGLNGWLVGYPMPRPPRDRWPEIEEYRAASATWQAAMNASPGHRAAHFRSADDVDECLELMAQSFVTNLFPSVFELPAYDAWYREQDQRATYARFADNLRLIGANEPEKPWLLKNPGHILALDALLAVFPDARIVQTHRDPATAMASIAALLAEVRRSALGTDVTTGDMAARELSLWSRAAADAMAARERHPENFHDVDYREFVADPMAAVHGVYDRFGIGVDAAVDARMRQWVADNPQGKHGVHAYDPLELGLTAEVVARAFGAYMREFGLA